MFIFNKIYDCKDYDCVADYFCDLYNDENELINFLENHKFYYEYYLSKRICNKCKNNFNKSIRRKKNLIKNYRY